MSTSSRPPCGEPNCCPLCNSTVQVTPTIFFGDTRCPDCHAQLWFVQAAGESRFYDAGTTLELRTRAQQFIAESLQIEPEKILNSPAVLEELGADSMDTLELLMELEEELERVSAQLAN